MQLTNKTPYQAERAVTMDKDAAENLIVAVKGTWAFAEGGGLELAVDQSPIALMDEYGGEPATTSIVQAFELGFPKPSTDVAMVGHAYARRRGTRQAEVTLRAGPIRKTVRVTGRRRWVSSFGFPRATKPEPFTSIPLIWENCYGGSDPEAKAWEPCNPVGRGFRGKKSKIPWKDTELPNIEHPKRTLAKPGDKSIPWGLGFVAPFWEPRRSRAGTYDAAWLEGTAPLLPADFQETFHHSVPDDQVAPQRFRGGEEIEVNGVGETGRLRGQVPRQFPVATVFFQRAIKGMALPLDTVVIDADAGELRLLWKGVINVHRQVLKIRDIRVTLAAAHGNGS